MNYIWFDCNRALSSLVLWKFLSFSFWLVFPRTISSNPQKTKSELTYVLRLHVLVCWGWLVEKLTFSVKEFSVYDFWSWTQNGSNKGKACTWIFRDCKREFCCRCLMLKKCFFVAAALETYQWEVTLSAFNEEWVKLNNKRNKHTKKGWQL